MYNLVKPLFVRAELLKRNIRVFTPRQLSIIFHLNTFQTEYVIRKLVRDGLLKRLKPGTYTIKTDPPDEKEIANALYKPSYISYDYALSYYQLIPEFVYQITSATTKPTRLFTYDSLAFGYYTIKKDAYTGFVLKEEKGRTFYIAQPEKAVVDYLYALSLGYRGLLGQRTINDRINKTSLSIEKIRHFAKLFAWRKLDELIQNTFLRAMT